MLGYIKYKVGSEILLVSQYAAFKDKRIKRMAVRFFYTS